MSVIWVIAPVCKKGYCLSFKDYDDDKLMQCIPFLPFPGTVSSMTWTDIQKLDASAKFQGSGSFSREKVPHLREMLAECKKHGT